MLTTDAWLGHLLGCPAYGLSDVRSIETLSRSLPKAPAFVTAKIPVSDVATSVALQDTGFRVIDTALTFDCDEIRPQDVSGGVRVARPQDRDAVESVARRSFRYSRFHLDPIIGKATANAIKAAWAGNFFAGKRGDGMIVAEQDGAVAGFLQLLRGPGCRMIIDLIAVDEKFARRGLASAMISFAANGLDGTAPSGFIVGTQAANVPSCRLYERLGFRLAKASYVLHHHGLSA